MEIGPPQLPPSPASRSTGRKKSAATDSADAQDRQAQEAAQERADELNSETAALEREEGDTLNRIRQDFDSQQAQEQEREQGALDSARLKGYENLRKLQQAQAAELSRVRREGEAELARLKEYYRNSTYHAASRGSEELRDLEQRRQEETGNEDLLARQRLDQLKKEEALRLESTRSVGDQRVQQALEQHREEFQKLRESSHQASDLERQHFEERFHRLLNDHQRSLHRVESASARQLGELRSDMSRKLAAYRARQTDPFYKLVNLDIHFSDEPGRYVLRALVPPQEREHVKVSVQGDRILLTGYRRSEEKLELDPGHSRSTSSYQSFNESFPVDWPVDPQRVTREYEGDWMIVSFPKKERPGPTIFRSPLSHSDARADDRPSPGLEPMRPAPARNDPAGEKS